MNSVVCTVAVMLMLPTHKIYREVVDAKGVIVREDEDNYYVDFSETFRSMNVDHELNTDVQWINSNNCLFYGE